MDEELHTYYTDLKNLTNEKLLKTFIPYDINEINKINKENEAEKEIELEERYDCNEEIKKIIKEIIS